MAQTPLLSAPVVKVLIQEAATVRLGLAPSPTATRVLGSLGAVMVCGYLIEKQFREALSPAGWTRSATPIAAPGSRSPSSPWLQRACGSRPAADV